MVGYVQDEREWAVTARFGWIWPAGSVGCGGSGRWPLCRFPTEVAISVGGSLLLVGGARVCACVCVDGVAASVLQATWDDGGCLSSPVSKPMVRGVGRVPVVPKARVTMEARIWGSFSSEFDVGPRQIEVAALGR